MKRITPIITCSSHKDVTLKGPADEANCLVAN